LTHTRVEGANTKQHIKGTYRRQGLEGKRAVGEGENYTHTLEWQDGVIFTIDEWYGAEFCSHGVLRNGDKS